MGDNIAWFASPSLLTIEHTFDIITIERAVLFRKKLGHYRYRLPNTEVFQVFPPITELERHFMIFFTSDHHFGNKNIIEHTRRPYQSVEEMDENLIARWNFMISNKDTVYHLGDFTLGDFDYFASIVEQLRFKYLFIIPGNHDWRWMKKFNGGANVRVLPPLYDLTVHTPNFKQIRNEKKIEITLCHYQILTWNKSHYGTYHLYGHSHGYSVGNGRSMDVGVDTNLYFPYSINDIHDNLITKMNQNEP